MLIIAMALVTLAERASFLLLKDRLRMPPLLERALAYVPAAVLSALVAPVVFSGDGASLGPVDARVMAAALAALVAWLTRSVIGTLAVGMGALWALSWLLG
ncbi:MAG TPA: AzlD domain-containing protein [Trueperaceae bacterium]|nr:AzlD domain-containing protein [Trueperaceae bacterium]